jgi:hypothetical protein
VIPNTKHIASRIFDLPDPFRPVIALKDSSNPGCQPDTVEGKRERLPEMVVRTGYDLKPEGVSSSRSLVDVGQVYGKRVMDRAS